MAAKHVVVVSDLHISAGALDDCDGELETAFCAFCSELAAEDQPIDLVVNGDFLDFVQAPPWRNSDLLHSGLFDSVSLEAKGDGVPLCFTQSQSVRKLQAIGIAHKPVFRALEKVLISHSGSQITILPGNHDADFFWTDVQASFRGLVCPKDPASRDRIVFHLDQVYRPAAFPGIWIEHGHQYDACNMFKGEDGKPRWAKDAPPIFPDSDGLDRLYECVGTRFLIKYLNEIDEAYPFVDNVKPFSRFVELFAASALSGGRFKIAVAMWRMMGFLAETLVGHPTDLLSVPEGEEFGLREHLADCVAAWPSSQQDELAVRIRAAGFIMGMPVEDTLRDAATGTKLLLFLSDHLELLDGFSGNGDSLLSADGEDGTLSLMGGFVVNETKTLKRAAAAILAQGGVDMVLMGHTHERVEPSPALAYINSGCWTRCLTFGTLDFAISWNMLKAEAADHFPYKLDYVDITGPGTKGARLRTYSA